MGEEPFRWENMLQENEADTLAILLRIKNESAAATGSRIRSSVGDQQFEDCNDWVSRLGMGFVWWCLPLAVGVGAGYFASSSLATVLVWIVSFDLDGNGLHFKCASLPPAALLYIGAGLFSWRRSTHIVRSGCRVRRAAFPQQHRRDYAYRCSAVIRSRNDLAKKTLTSPGRPQRALS